MFLASLGAILRLFGCSVDRFIVISDFRAIKGLKLRLDLWQKLKGSVFYPNPIETQPKKSNIKFFGCASVFTGAIFLLKSRLYPKFASVFC